MKRRRRPIKNTKRNQLQTTLRDRLGEPKVETDEEGDLTWTWNHNNVTFCVTFARPEPMYDIDDTDSNIMQGGSGESETLDAMNFFLDLTGQVEASACEDS